MHSQRVFTSSLKVDECKALVPGGQPAAVRPGRHGPPQHLVGEGFHSSTSQPNLSAFYGIGVAFRVCLQDVGVV
jgi:hypothetical protein